MRVLLSVYDKSGVVELARSLHDLGCDLVSSGGTAKAIAEAGVPVRTSPSSPGSQPILGHRVVTLHPKVHGGILADPTDPEHLADMGEHGIEPFDLVVINAYPFGTDPADFEHGGNAGAMDVLDIGGPGHDPGGGQEPRPRRRRRRPGRLRRGARRAAGRRRAVGRPAATAGPQGLRLHRRLRRRASSPGSTTRRAASRSRDTLAPHLPSATRSSCATARTPTRPPRSTGTAAAEPWWARMTQHAGHGAQLPQPLRRRRRLAARPRPGGGDGQPACAIIKHANPCGAAVADTLADAYRLAFECDPRSAFGGIVAVDRADRRGHGRGDGRRRPGRRRDRAGLRRRRRRRARRQAEEHPPARGAAAGRPTRATSGRSPVACSCRTRTTSPRPASDWRVVTQRVPTEAEWADAELALRLCGWVKSNSHRAREGRRGLGHRRRPAEPGRGRARSPRPKAAGRAAGGACASDAFYPFPDGIEAAADAGVAVIVQPGGSVKDEDTIARADERGVAMVFTGERHFLH